MALKLGELVAYLRADNSHFDRGIDSSKRKMRELAQEFDRTGKTSLLGDLDKERSRLNQLERAAAELGTGGLASARNALSNFGSVAINVGSNLWSLIPVFTGIAAAAAFAIPGISLLGGVLGAIPAVSVGVGAGVGALALGFMGIGDQFKKTASAGKAVVDTEHQIAIAERNLADAQDAEARSLENINRARAAAKKNIDDLTRSLKDQRLQEEEAAQSVDDAKHALEVARRFGTAVEIKHADLAYRQSQQTLEDVQAQLKDTEEQQKQAAAAGVEGSDQVKSALDQQHKATEQVADAQYALEQAHKSQSTAAAGAAAETTKLAASAQHLVDVVKSLKPAFEDLRLDVQQRLFAGVGDEVKKLADAWLPMLHDKLGQSADTANSLFKLFSSSIRKPEFIERIGVALDAVDRQVDKIGSAVAGPLVDAFGRLAANASPFLDAVGDEVAGLVTDFSDWIKKADESGALKDFFKQAGDFFHDVMDMGKDVGAIIGDIVQALFDDPANSKGGSTWEKLKKTLDDLKAWFDDKDNQKKIQEWFQQLQHAGEAFLIVAGWIAGLILWLDRAEWKISGWAASAYKAVEGFVNGAGNQWDRLIGWVEGLPGRISRATSGMWNGMIDSFRWAMNMIIWNWNRLHFTLPDIDWGPIHLGGGQIGVPHVPYLADGGVVRATPGGRLAVVGEGGQDEAVIPLNKLAAMLGAGGGRTTRVVAETDDDLLSVLFRLIRWKVVGEYGGDVKAAFAGK